MPPKPENRVWLIQERLGEAITELNVDLDMTAAELISALELTKLSVFMDTIGQPATPVH